MTDFIAGLRGAPKIYPQKLDLVQDRILLIAFDERDYRSASFLDDRILRPATQGAWAPFEAVAGAAQDRGDPAPLHFIFHAGHVGSTLLSRLIDETGRVLGLREPLPLRTLAEAHDLLGRAESFLDGPQFDRRLETMLLLWSRRFAATDCVVLKSTSSSARLAPRLLSTRPGARAVYLNLAAEPYLATLLAGANAVLDLRGFGLERIRRLEGLIGEPPPALHSLSTGELAAMSWLAETLTQQSVTAQFGARVLGLDFEVLLSGIEQAMAAVLAHFAIVAPDGFLAGLPSSPVLARYSKAPEQFAYSPGMRSELLAQARRDHASEIRKGLDWLEKLGARNRAVAAVL